MAKYAECRPSSALQYQAAPVMVVARGELTVVHLKMHRFSRNAWEAETIKNNCRQQGQCKSLLMTLTTSMCIKAEEEAFQALASQQGCLHVPHSGNGYACIRLRHSTTLSNNR